MNACPQKVVWFSALFLTLGWLTGGCTTKSTARLEAQNAFLAGQNEALRQQLQKQQSQQGPSVTVQGAVQYHQVPWVAGMTLAQAVATAGYVGQDAPTKIILTHNGQSATMDANILFSGKDIPLEAGDIIELR